MHPNHIIEPVQKVVLEGIIGRGSFGNVYKGSFCGLPVAAKIVNVSGGDTITKDSIRRESALLKYTTIILIMYYAYNYRSVHHPNLSCLLGIVEVDQGLAILTPLVNGPNLHQLLFEERKTVGSTAL